MDVGGLIRRDDRSLFNLNPILVGVELDGRRKLEVLTLEDQLGQTPVRVVASVLKSVGSAIDLIVER